MLVASSVGGVFFVHVGFIWTAAATNIRYDLFGSCSGVLQIHLPRLEHGFGGVWVRFAESAVFAQRMLQIREGWTERGRNRTVSGSLNFDSLLPIHSMTCGWVIIPVGWVFSPHKGSERVCFTFHHSTKER